MANTVTTVNSALVARLLNTLGDEMIQKLIKSHFTATLVSRYGNVKKTLEFMVFTKNKRFLRGYKSDGTAKGDEYSYDKVTLEVAKFMSILNFEAMDDVAEAFQSWLEGMGKNVGQLADDMYARLLFQFLLGETERHMADEMEDADWQAIKVTSGINSAADADMIHKFDGFRRLAATLCNTGKGTIVTTGAVDATNAVAKVELMYKALDPRVKRFGALIFCNDELYENYKDNWRSSNSGRELGVTRLEGTDYEAIPLYHGNGKTRLISVPGYGTGDSMIATIPEYMAIGFQNIGGWDVQKKGFMLEGYRALKYGVMFKHQTPGYLLCNDRLIAVEITTPRTNA